MSHTFRSTALALALTVVFSAAPAAQAKPHAASKPAAAARALATADESTKVNAFFERLFNEDVARSPMASGYLGLKQNMDKWDDFSEAHRLEELGRTVAHLAELKNGYDYSKLDEQTRLSWRLFVEDRKSVV